MSDSGTIVRELFGASERGESVVLATVVRTVGSAYRGVGTRMIIGADDTASGLVSGGCLEADLIARATGVRTRGRAELVTYDSRSDEDLVWGLGLGCDGLVEVLLEPLSSKEAGTFAGLLRSALDRSEPSVMATIISTEGLGAKSLWSSRGEMLGATGATGPIERAEIDAAIASGRRGTVVREEGSDVALEVIEAPLRMVICGSGPDVVPVAELGAAQGWSVTVVEHRAPDPSRARRFPHALVVDCESTAQLRALVPLDGRTAAVVMSHDYPRDSAYFAELLQSDAAYIGVLGPRRRTERMLGEMRERGSIPHADALDRVHAPVGLDIGGDGPNAIAVAIVAEISAVLSGRPGTHLRDRMAPIHDDAMVSA